eukprot:38388-Lingulodinium_polyedra.AAC.1
MIDRLWATGVLSSWADVESIIEHHAPRPPVEEGLEVAQWEVVDDSDDDDDGGDDDDAKDGGGDDGHDHGGDSALALATVQRAATEARIRAHARTGVAEA